jgi:hypothetical protein
MNDPDWYKNVIASIAKAKLSLAQVECELRSDGRGLKSDLRHVNLCVDELSRLEDDLAFRA